MYHPFDVGPNIFIAAQSNPFLKIFDRPDANKPMFASIFAVLIGLNDALQKHLALDVLRVKRLKAMLQLASMICVVHR